MEISGSVAVRLGITGSKSIGSADIKSVSSFTETVQISNGSGANQANLLYQEETQLADAANVERDLNDGSLTDAFGDAVAMTILRALYIKNSSADASLLIGGSAATQLGLFADGSDILKLRPGGMLLVTAPDATGVAVTGSGDLKLTHDGTGSDPLTFELIALGSA